MIPPELLQQSNTISSTVSALNERMNSLFKQSLAKQQQELKTSYATYLQLQQQFYKSEATADSQRSSRRKSEMQGFLQGMGSALESVAKQQEKQLTSMTTSSERLLSTLGTSLLSTMGRVLSEGRSFAESTGKILVGTALQALDSLVPIIVAQITGVQLASPNPANALSFGTAGIASAIALTATFKGLVALAKSAAGFKDGGLVKGGQQFIRINEVGQEFVMNAQSTKAFLPELQQLNSGHLPNSFLPPNSKYSFEQTVAKKIDNLIETLHSRKTTVHNTISVSGTFRANGGELQTLIEKHLQRKVVL